MKHFLLVALTATLSLMGCHSYQQKDGKKVWATHKVLDNRTATIFRNYDSFTEKSWCTRDSLNTALFKSYELSNDSIKFRRKMRWVDIKYGNEKPIRIWSKLKVPEAEARNPYSGTISNFMYEYYVIPFSQYSKYKKIRFRYSENGDYYKEHSLNILELEKHIKSFEACERSTSK